MKKNLSLFVLLVLFLFKGSNAYSQYWTPLSSGMDMWVHCFKTDPANQVLYAGGSFSHAGGTAVKRIAQWDGVNWSPLGSGLAGPTAASQALAMSMYNGHLYVGGRFETAGGVNAYAIAKWDGTAWSGLGAGMSPVNSYVLALAVYNGELYAAGSFSNAGGTSVQNIAKWNGSAWSDVGGGLGGSVYSLMNYNGELYACGGFSTAGGNPAPKIAKWNGTAWSAVGTGPSTGFSVLQTYNGKLYAGGGQLVVDGNSMKGIATWNGTAWDSVGLGISLNNSVAALEVYNGKLYVGGGFGKAGEIPVKNIASWDGTSWDSVGAGIRDVFNTTPIVKSLAFYNGALVAGGCFSVQAGGPTDYISAFNLTTEVKPESNSLHDLLVFPNPVQAGEKLTVELEEPFSMKVYSLTGETVSHISSGSNQNVQLPHLAKGLYILDIHSAQGSVHRKLVVK